MSFYYYTNVPRLLVFVTLLYLTSRPANVKLTNSIVFEYTYL